MLAVKLGWHCWQTGLAFIVELGYHRWQTKLAFSSTMSLLPISSEQSRTGPAFAVAHLHPMKLSFRLTSSSGSILPKVRRLIGTVPASSFTCHPIHPRES